MKKAITEKDLEALSAYLDGALSEKERQRMASLLKERADLRQEFAALQRTRALLRSQPRIRAPRRFTLTPEMVRQKRQERSLRLIFSTFRAASLTSVALLVILSMYSFLFVAGVPGFMLSAVPKELREYPAVEIAKTVVITEEVQAMLATEEALEIVEATLPVEKPLQETPLLTPAEVSFMEQEATETPIPSLTEDMRAAKVAEEPAPQEGELTDMGGGMEEPRREVRFISTPGIVVLQVLLGLSAVGSAVAAVWIKKKLR